MSQCLLGNVVRKLLRVPPPSEQFSECYDIQIVYVSQ